MDNKQYFPIPNRNEFKLYKLHLRTCLTVHVSCPIPRDCAHSWKQIQICKHLRISNRWTMCCSLELNGSYRRWRKDDHWLTCVWVLWVFFLLIFCRVCLNAIFPFTITNIVTICMDGIEILWCGVVILYISVHGWSQNTVVWLFCTSQCTDGVRILWCGYFAHFSAKPDAFTWTSNSSISEGFLLRVFWCNRCLSLQNIK